MYNIVLIETDDQYVSRLAAYARESVFAKTLSIIGLTEPSSIKAFFSSQEGGSVDLIAGTRELLDNHDLYGRQVSILTLVEDWETAGQMDELLFKYSPAPHLLARMQRMCEAELPRYVREDGRECAILSVFSAAGGCGKSTVAINAAHLLAECGQKVCLLNFEAFESYAGMESDSAGEGVDFSRLLYETTAKPDCPLDPSWFAPGIGRRWFSPIRRSGLREWEELKESDAALLLRKLAWEGPFDTIVVDLEASLHPRVLAALAASQQVLWLLQNDEACDRKTLLLLEELKREHPLLEAKLRHTVKFGLNKHTGTAYRGQFAGFGSRPLWDFELPYVPAWKHASGFAELLREPVFQARLQPLLPPIVEPALEAR